jgi:parvulin-like peptidyl-prolyl isomerase
MSDAKDAKAEEAKDTKAEEKKTEKESKAAAERLTKTDPSKSANENVKAGGHPTGTTPGGAI